MRMMLYGKMRSRQNMGSISWVGGVRKVLILTELVVGNLSSQVLNVSGLERFKSLVHFGVKDGSRVLFWHDVWCRDQTLKT